MVMPEPQPVAARDGGGGGCPLLKPLGCLSVASAGAVLAAVAALAGEARSVVDLSGVSGVEEGAGRAFLAALGRLRRGGLDVALAGADVLVPDLDRAAS
jgi:anti-anti-sigma regulatory factor